MTIASIATFGISSVLLAMACGAVVGAGLGGLNALSSGDNILYGILSGFVVGALSGLGGSAISGVIISSITAAFGAATMSLIGDRVNGRQRGFVKAGVSFLTAGVFSFLGSGAGGFLSSVGNELIVNIEVSSLASFIFNSYTFIADIIYDKTRR